MSTLNFNFCLISRINLWSKILNFSQTNYEILIFALEKVSFGKDFDAYHFLVIVSTAVN